MKHSVTVQINCPQQLVAQLLANPSLNKHWMDDLEAYEQLSGTPGAPGSTARLSFKKGRHSMTFVSTLPIPESPSEAEHQRR